jgi:hypothetical protein
MSETQRDHAAAPLLVARMARLVRDESTLAGLREAREGLVEVADATDTVLHRLTEAYRLSRFQQDLVLLAGLVEEHEAVTRVMRTLHPTGEPALSVTAAAAGAPWSAACYATGGWSQGPSRCRCPSVASV